LVDPANWTAAAWPVKETAWNGSDLANGNVLRSQGSSLNAKPETPQLVETGKGYMSVYPNPVQQHQFQLRLRDLNPGGYHLEITDMLGRQVLTQAVQISQENSTLPVVLPKGQTQGLYLIKLSGTSFRASYQQKIMIQ